MKDEKHTMTPAQLKSWRAKAGLTQSEAAAIFYKCPRQYQNWEAGKSPVPKLVEDKINKEAKKVPR